MWPRNSGAAPRRRVDGACVCLPCRLACSDQRSCAAILFRAPPPLSPRRPQSTVRVQVHVVHLELDGAGRFGLR